MDIVDVILDSLVQYVNYKYHALVIVLMQNMENVNWMENVNVKKDLVDKHVVKNLRKNKKRRRNM